MKAPRLKRLHTVRFHVHDILKKRQSYRVRKLITDFQGVGLEEYFHYKGVQENVWTDGTVLYDSGGDYTIVVSSLKS